MNKIDFLSLKKCNLPYEEEIKRVVCDVIESGWYLNGKNIATLEQKVAEVAQTQFCVACSNGLDALRLIFRAYIEMGVMQEGDEVIVPANTYIASILAVTDNRLKPIFVEPSEKTMNIDIDKIESAITPRTRAVMVVHLYGNPCWDEKLNILAKRHGVKIIEDNAQAIGAVAHCNGLHGTAVTGGLGDASGFSFYPTKNIGAFGDAGAVTTNDEKLYQTVKALVNYGTDRRYHNLYAGLNCRMDEIQAAILLVKLKHLDEISAERQKKALIYDAEIKNSLIVKPIINKNEKQVWHQYEIRVTERRDEFREFLAVNGVATDIHYAVPPHLQPCYKEFSHLDLPITEHMANTLVSLPIAESVSENDIHEIANIVNKFV